MHQPWQWVLGISFSPWRPLQVKIPPNNSKRQNVQNKVSYSLTPVVNIGSLLLPMIGLPDLRNEGCGPFIQWEKHQGILNLFYKISTYNKIWSQLIDYFTNSKEVIKILAHVENCLYLQCFCSIENCIFKKAM